MGLYIERDNRLGGKRIIPYTLKDYPLYYIYYYLFLYKLTVLTVRQ